MNQHDAPVGSVATIGHPANNCLIVRFSGGWRYIESGDVVDSEDFRAGWDLVDARRQSVARSESVTAIPVERLREIRQMAREQPRRPFVDPMRMGQVRGVLARRGEAWAEAVVGRAFDRRSLVDARVPWLREHEPDVLLVADAAEDVARFEVIVSEGPDQGAEASE